MILTGQPVDRRCHRVSENSARNGRHERIAVRGQSEQQLKELGLQIRRECLQTPKSRSP